MRRVATVGILGSLLAAGCTSGDGGSAASTSVQTTTVGRGVAAEFDLTPSEVEQLLLYRDDCTTVAFGRDRTETRGDEIAGSWTGSPSGQWLADVLDNAGISNPLDVGSAFVVAHGIDGVAFLWVGPVHQDGGLSAIEGENAVHSSVVEPVEPHAAGGYRDATVLTTIAGGVRLWLLVNPRDLHERSNFGTLPPDVPCLPTDGELTHLLLEVADAASLSPFDGPLPTGAGAFAINTDPGHERVDPSVRYLGRSRSVENPWDSDGGTILLRTHIPPYETDPNTLSRERSSGPAGRISAGGIDLLAVQPIANGSQPVLDERQHATLNGFAESMNRDPFLGQTAD